jgi:FAD/FMN-containing dehydrogenase
MRLPRRELVAGALVVIPAWLVGRPLVHLGLTALREGKGYPPTPAGRIDDASHLDETAVARIVPVHGSATEAEAIVGDALLAARARGLPVSIAGARHSMGGHAIARDGVVLDMTGVAHISSSDGDKSLTVGAGARWHDVIAYLDTRAWSVAIMQSNDSFSVGGSLSVNCHGWQPNRPPISSTVESLRVVRPDGTGVTCSREVEPELFACVLGGYGLFGVIVEATVRVTDNAMYAAERYTTIPDEYPQLLREKAGDAGLAFGRLSIVPDALFDEAILTVYRRDPSFAGPVPPVGARERSRLARLLFRGEVESDYGKGLRWFAEKRLGGEGGGRATRNQLLNEPVELFTNRRAENTDVLHEYFVPAEAFASFVGAARRIVRAQGGDLLNATVRNVVADHDTRLPYAKIDVLGVVMLFSQKRTREADASMRAMTCDLVDACLALGGRHYLPYRLHATRDQLRRGYPDLDAFLAAKRAIDPDRVLRSGFYDYLTQGASG